jgi:hypothetical protein
MLNIAISCSSPVKAVDTIVGAIEDDILLIALARHDNWMVRTSVAKYAGGLSYTQLLGLERDEDERVRDAAIERHASDLSCLAAMYAKKDKKTKKHGIQA